jgi:general secretion pathway protein G
VGKGVVFGRKFTRKGTKRNKGFTLIEILAVLIILGLLAALIVPKVISRVEQSRIETTKLQMKAIKNALEQYKLDNGFYPTTQQGLKALVQKPTTPPIPQNWHQYLEKVPKDAWGHPFIYISPAPNHPYDLKSVGPDGKEGTEDDIDIWNI